MYNNVFIGKDSLIKGKDKIGDVKYQGNDWWSIDNGFNIDGIHDFRTWALKQGQEEKDGKVIGLNIKPEFKNPGNTTITSAAQLKNFTNYQLGKNSLLRKKSVYTDRYGLKNIKL